MKAWKLGSIINGLFVGATLVLIILLLFTRILPENGFTRSAYGILDESNIFKLGGRYWWKLMLFVIFTLGYFIMGTIFPLSILSKSIELLHPEKGISSTPFWIYSIFGLLTPGGIFFLLGLFFIKKDLWEKREVKFRNFVDDLERGELDNNNNVNEEHFEEEHWEEESPSYDDSDLPAYDRRINKQNEFDDSVVRKVDKLERRLDGIEDDLYYQKRKTRGANKVLDDIQDALNNR